MEARTTSGRPGRGSAAPAPMRRDARERREKLLRAATRSFREEGYRVPLEVIARSAGVGRGTLYRNFKDRADLILAIFDDELARAGERIAGMDDLEEVLSVLVAAAAPLAALHAQLASDLLRDARTRTGFEEIGRRTARVLEPVVARAHAAGLLRASVGVADVQMVFRMAGGLILPTHGEEEARAVSRGALALLMDGLRPR